MRADVARLEGLQRTMVRAVYGDAEAFGAVVSTIETAGIDSEKRLFVHLNTVNHALTAVLQQAYPATARLLGAKHFAGVAKAFIRAQPPQRPVLSAYGAEFAVFLAETGALPEGLACLPLLDWAAHEAYFAGPAVPLTGDRLAAVPPEEHATLMLRPVPSARIVKLRSGEVWVHWTALLPADEILVTAPIRSDTAGALIWRRPDLRVAAQSLNAGEAAFLDALEGGKCVLDAAAIADEGRGLNLSDLMAFCLTNGVLCTFDAAAS